MKIQFWSVGKAHESYVKEGIEVFTKRIKHFFPVEWILISPPKVSPSSSVDQIKKAEGEMLFARLQKDDYLIALDENGSAWSSPQLANFIQGKANEGKRNLIFLIGGAYGIDEAVMQRANEKWSLSKLVFPHQLVRLILAEQIYRACTIIRNEKYHHA